MGESRRPDGSTITLDSDSLRLNGKPWTPVMGEFHYARYPENEWREELLKMKAGGIDIVATYVFWIHHEEVEGAFDWSGSRSLRHFIETAGNVGLKSIVRCGPWCHGEVRNGGLPDWVLKNGWKTRSTDTNFLAAVRILYSQIATQLNGLLWKDGGPVIGIQLDNEYHGPSEYLLSLKRIARDVGLDVPIYTRTGWPSLTTPMPFGEIVPLYGVYAEGFWDRELTPMPGKYWAGFHFSTLRVDDNIANELLGRRNARDDKDAARYPYLTCEIGGGMMNSYHRRIFVYPADVESTTLVKIGSGSSSPGYYMYHGGVNPEGKLTTLMESQDTGYWNDMPVKNYDFQAPLGQYGQIRPQYHLLRRLHLILHEWGSQLAQMPPTMPDQRPSGRDDVTTLRWCVRSDGQSGFVFVNNYERLKELPAKPDVQFALSLPSGKLTFPEEPVTVPSASRFIWPFNMDLGHGLKVKWATAQPVTAIEDGGVRTVFFAKTAGVPVEFVFDDNETKIIANSSQLTRRNGLVYVRDVEPGKGAALQLSGSNATVRIVLLDSASSLDIWKGNWQGRDRVVLADGGVVFDGDALRLSTTNEAPLTLDVSPAPSSVELDGRQLRPKSDGVFQQFTLPAAKMDSAKPFIQLVQAAGPPREIPIGKISRPVATEPDDADFDKAAIWQVKLPHDVDLEDNPILRLHYTGDVARIMLNGKFITDDFYNGKPFDIGLRRHAPEILNGDLRIAILPLRKDAPIYMADAAKPGFGTKESVVNLDRVEIVESRTVQLKAE